MKTSLNSITIRLILNVLILAKIVTNILMIVFCDKISDYLIKAQDLTAYHVSQESITYFKFGEVCIKTD